MNKKIALAILLIFGIFQLGNTAKGPYSDKFNQWKKKFGVKFHSSSEEAYRQQVFNDNLALIEEHNSDQHRTYDQGINKFTGLTKKQFQETYLGLSTKNTNQASSIQLTGTSTSLGVTSLNWVQMGYVTGVKDQGQCGSCWSFSATGALEGLSMLKNGNLQNFSEQQLIDCSRAVYNNSGCNGGLMTKAFSFVRDNGIVHQQQYPYSGKQQTCKISNGNFKISGYYDIRNSCSKLSQAIQKQPISVAVDCTNWAFYQSGVFSRSPTSLNHGVLLVGVVNGDWLIKNSWGTSWGQNGYIRLKGTVTNNCGICAMFSYPIA